MSVQLEILSETLNVPRHVLLTNLRILPLPLRSAKRLTCLHRPAIPTTYIACQTDALYANCYELHAQKVSPGSLDIGFN